MKSYSAMISVGVFAALVGSTVSAQTKTTEQPTAIGVSQETANKVHRDAVKKGDTATVVRTGPNAADKASDMASDAKDSVKDTTDKTKSKMKANDTTKQ